jgi:hypothetical protein
VTRIGSTDRGAEREMNRSDPRDVLVRSTAHAHEREAGSTTVRSTEMSKVGSRAARLAVIAAVGVGVIAGCGGKSSGGSSTVSPANGSNSSSTTPTPSQSSTSGGGSGGYGY